MKNTLIVAALLFTMPPRVLAAPQSFGPLIFEPTPAIEMDESANFKKCGYELLAKNDNNNWNTSLRVTIWKDKSNEYFVAIHLAKRAEISSDWEPRDSLIKWARLGSAEPIEVDPYGMIANPSEGFSYSSTRKSSNFYPFAGMEKPTTNVWVQVFDRVKQERITYYGIINNSQATTSLVKQCLEGINKIEKRK